MEVPFRSDGLGCLERGLESGPAFPRYWRAAMPARHYVDVDGWGSELISRGRHEGMFLRSIYQEIRNLFIPMRWFTIERLFFIWKLLKYQCYLLLFPYYIGSS